MSRRTTHHFKLASGQLGLLAKSISLSVLIYLILATSASYAAFRFPHHLRLTLPAMVIFLDASLYCYIKQYVHLLSRKSARSSSATGLSIVLAIALIIILAFFFTQAIAPVITTMPQQ